VEQKVLFLSEKEVRSLLEPKQVVELIERVFREEAAGRTVCPPKLVTHLYPHRDSFLNCMPAYLSGLDMLGVKMAGYNFTNRALGVPNELASIVLFDPETGAPKCVMDGTFITAIRTGGVSAVCSKYLSVKDCRTLTILGAGAQGRTNLRCLMAVHPQIEEVRVVEVLPQVLERYLKDAEGWFPNVKFVPCGDVQQACRGVKIICSCASAPHSLLEHVELDPGTHVLKVAERMPKSAMRKKFDRIIGDDPLGMAERTNQASGWIAKMDGRDYTPLRPEDVADGRLSDVIAGRFPGRLNDRETIISGGAGMGMEDVIVAEAAYRAALERGVGVTVDMAASSRGRS